MAGESRGEIVNGSPPLPFDTSVAHVARVYNYWLGGKDNFAADREAAEQVIAANPTVLPGVRANRAFLGRAVRYLAAEAGIRQFLDLGTGLPTAQNTHQVAQEIAHAVERVREVINQIEVAAPSGRIPLGHDRVSAGAERSHCTRG